MDSIAASIEAIASAVRISYGPCGKDQLVVTESQKLVTNAASRILSLARPGSPVAKVILSHIRRCAEDLGDGAGTLALLLHGAVGFCATALRDGRARRQELERCFVYIEACLLPSEASQLLTKLRRPGGVSPEETVQDLAVTFFGANFPPEVSRQLGKICWHWLRENSEAKTSLPGTQPLARTASQLRSGELVKVPSTRLGGACEPLAAGTSSASVERTHILEGVLAHSTMPAAVEGGRALVLDEQFAPLPVCVSVPGAALDRLGELLLMTTERLWQAGVRVVLCAAEMHEEWKGAMARRGILLLHLVDDEELSLLERGRAALGRARRARLGVDDVASFKAASFQLSSARPLLKSSSTQLSAGRAFWLLKPSTDEPMHHCFLLLRAPSASLAIEHRLALLRLLAVVAPALKDPHLVVAGGLAFELALLRLARSRGVANSGAPASVESQTRNSAPHKEVFGIDDEDKAARLRRLAWSLLESALLSVVEAFLDNLVASGPKGGRGLPSPAARRTARLLAVATAEELPGAAPGLQQVPWHGDEASPLFGFVISPGIGGCEDRNRRHPVETAPLKLELLKALCGLGRQLCRLDPETVQGRGTAVPAKRSVSAAPGKQCGSDSDFDSSGDD